MRSIFSIAGTLSFFLLLLSCQTEFDRKYSRPDWIEGKLFEQLQSIPETDSFEVCVKLAGYDTILNNTNFTVFAPDNEAFRLYLEGRPGVGGIRDLSEAEIRGLVEQHILQNPWSRDQLQRANETGWIDEYNPDKSQPWGFKRQTLRRDPSREYWVQSTQEGITCIVDSSESKDSRLVYQNSRKYAPVFFEEYMRIANIGSRDYEFYFSRPHEPGVLYLAGARLSDTDYFAENGFIYVLDRVVPPLRNVEQVLEAEDRPHSYKLFLELIHQFPEFEFNEEQTMQQEGVEEGMEVSPLYDLNYAELVFNIHEEMTGETSQTEMTSTRYHYGMLAPTDRAFTAFIENFLTTGSGNSNRWPSFEEVPRHIRRSIVNAHMREAPIFLSDLERGYLSGEWDSTFVDPSTVIEKEFASNASFFGLDQALVPRAFSSVTAPVYLRPQYMGFSAGLDASGLAPVMKRKNASYSFFVVQVAEDYFAEWSQERLMNLFLEQACIRVPSELSRKEFLPTMGGNFVVYDTTRRPRRLEEETDNGVSFAANGFNWPNQKDLEWQIHGKFRSFFDLIEKAGMMDRTWWDFTFVNKTEFYTVFAPSDEALEGFDADKLSQEELQRLVLHHFIPGEIIFTDGFKAGGSYATLCKDDHSSEFFESFLKLNILSEPGTLGIRNGEGELITSIHENDGDVNLMFGRRQESYRTLGVIHAIDTLLIPEMLHP